RPPPAARRREDTAPPHEGPSERPGGAATPRARHREGPPMRERAYPPIHEWSGQVADAVAARLVHEAIAHALGMQQDLEACGRWAVAGLTDDQHERVAGR